MRESSVCPQILIRPWRESAARIVEELFPVTPATRWDDLLDLRGLLLHGSDWSAVLDRFQICRHELEEDHYLPFYRLRRLLSAHLRLEHADESGRHSLAQLLRSRRSAIRKPSGSGRPLRLVEQV